MQRGDVARLTGIPGIGKKTAERIVLELQDRLAQLPAQRAVDAAHRSSARDRLRDDLLSALQNLGYHRPQAEKAVDATLPSMPDADVRSTRCRRALRELMR